MTFVEPVHAGEAISSIADPALSMEAETVAAGQNLSACQIVGRITKGAAAAVANGSNTGNGAMSSIVVGVGSIAGIYVLTMIEPGATADFFVEDPDGNNIGAGNVGAAFSQAGLGFTLSDGASDFAAGDTFHITVVSGSDEIATFDPAATDGTEFPCGMLHGSVDATTSAQPGVIVARNVVLADSSLIWPTDITVEQKAAAVAELKKTLIKII